MIIVGWGNGSKAPLVKYLQSFEMSNIHSIHKFVLFDCLINELVCECGGELATRRQTNRPHGRGDSSCFLLRSRSEHQCDDYKSNRGPTTALRALHRP